MKIRLEVFSFAILMAGVYLALAFFVTNANVAFALYLIYCYIHTKSITTIMNSASVYSAREEIISRILRVDDISLLDKIKGILSSQSEEVEQGELSRNALVEDLQSAFKEGLEYKKGKVKGTPAREFLDEL